MGFVQHIKEIFFVENGGQRNSQEENEKKIQKKLQKNFLHCGLLHRSLDFESKYLFQYL
jgi:hypothetical protein